MIYIRKGVFETNSSSTHAIVIAREGTKISDYHHVVFSIGEFGWECATYYDADKKAEYFYTAACAFLERDVADDIKALLEPYGIECIFHERPIFKDHGTYKYLENGYVDHDSECQDFVEGLLGDASQLIDFIFNDKSYVETGNDNDSFGVGGGIPDCKYIEYYKGN